ncbi:type II secretion system protein F [Bacteriovorax sp. DB6_IX]|nr:type II secretion system protein F [Bacteriovorax sp. DB6_IX]
MICFLSPTAAWGQSKNAYDDFGKRELAKLLEESCNKGMTSSCFELGLLYQDFKESKFKYDKIDYAKKGKELVKKACEDGEIHACEHLKGENRFEGSQFLLYSAIALIGIAVLIVTRMMFQDNEQFQASQKLDEDEDKKTKESKSHGVVLQYSRPFFKRYVSPIVAQMKNKKKIKEKYRRKLASSGLTDVLTTEDFFAFKLFLIIGFPVVFIAVRSFMEADWPLKAVPVIAAIGFIYPDIWVKGKIEQRQKGIISGMPFAVDMLALSVEAGLDFVAAMTKVVEKARPGPLTEEFEIMIKEIKVGASRAEALRNMAWRIDLIPISSFCATLIAADSVGASIGPILKALSEEIRQKKSAEVEKEGATAATKILFPMMAFIIPAVFLMVAAPIIVEFVAGN